MKRKLQKKQKELELELHDIFERLLENPKPYEEANIRERAKKILAQLELIEEVLGESEAIYTPAENKIIFGGDG
mgnify:CR=1 FL=1